MIKSLYPTFQKWCETGSIYIISDTHFEDSDCAYMDPLWINPEVHFNILSKKIHNNDTLIHLGDVGNVKWLDKLKCYKILITGNHDTLSKLRYHFYEIYTGPLFISDRILLSHELIYGLEQFCVNIHGHDHNGVPYSYNEYYDRYTHINLASNVYNYQVFNLGESIKNGILSKIPNYHRITIDTATKNSINKGAL